MLAEAKNRKCLDRVRKAFVQLAGCKSWDTATTMFPKHTEDLVLNQYASLFGSIKGFVMPAVFKNFVQSALDSKKAKFKQSNWSEFIHPTTGKKLEYLVQSCNVLEQLAEFSTILEKASLFLADIPYGLKQQGSPWNTEDWQNPEEQIQKVTWKYILI
jgi:hypothetical protein